MRRGASSRNHAASRGMSVAAARGEDFATAAARSRHGSCMRTCEGGGPRARATWCALLIILALAVAAPAMAASLTRRPYLQLLTRQSVTVGWHTGDMIYDAGAPQDFDPTFFAPYRDIVRHLVLWPCLGNHDVETASGAPWRDAFYTPANNPAASEDYYSFDAGNAHIVVLDSNAITKPGSPQYVFLDHDLAATTATWKVVVFHHTIYSSGTKHGSNLIIRANLVPLFDTHGADLVLMAHEHSYERTKPLHA